MKVTNIQKDIVGNYNKVISLINREPQEKRIHKVYAMMYKAKHSTGTVSEMGYISRDSKLGTKIEMRIIDGAIQSIKKPFYMTTKYACKKINNMLEKISQNVGTDSVKQSCVRCLIFPKEILEKFAK